MSDIASPASEVVASRTVLVKGRHMYRHLLIPTDGSRLSDEAIQHGVKLAADAGAKVTFLTVTEPSQTLHHDACQQARMRATHILIEADKLAEAARVVHDVVQMEDDEPYRAIIQTAERKGCDLIVMASNWLRGLSVLLLGSETVKVLTHSTIPVLVYRSPSRRPYATGWPLPHREDVLPIVLHADASPGSRVGLGHECVAERTNPQLIAEQDGFAQAW